MEQTRPMLTNTAYAWHVLVMVAMDDYWNVIIIYADVSIIWSPVHAWEKPLVGRNSVELEEEFKTGWFLRTFISKQIAKCNELKNRHSEIFKCVQLDGWRGQSENESQT